MKKIISSLVATLAITTVSLNAADYYASVNGLLFLCFGLLAPILLYLR